ncbi:MAG: glycosyltransferase family 4 protein [Rubricoccaceae bacterium]|nr:glycosyltransferase family 4 protein [Rubricoccaceae bacterium]
MTDPLIVWQNASPVLLEAVRTGQLGRRANGGIAYEYHSVRALEPAFRVAVDPEAVRRPEEPMLRYWARMRRHAPAGAALVVQDPRARAFAARPGAPTVAVVHHIDYTLQRSSLKHRWYFARLFDRLAEADAVVTVSQFWKGELERAGCRRVEVIYNAFDGDACAFDADDLAAFRDAHALPHDRPLVYIGNASKLKGVEEVYHALKGEGYTLVMSGRNNDTDVPARWFDLPRPDYLRLLAACDVVVCMSRLLEGWNRVAHEAMLCGTPVIGSGAGGMRELLEGGGQVVLPDAAGLPEAVRTVLDRREAQGRAGKAYAARFDGRYFEAAWTSLARNMMEQTQLVTQ